MTETKLVVIETPELKSLGTEKSAQIRATFEPMTALLAEFEDKFNEIASVKEADIDKDVCARAKRLRLDIGRVRIDTAKLHKVQKAEYLTAGRAIDGVKNILTWAVTEKENRLKEIENHFVNIENLRLDTLRLDRIESLVKNTDIDTDTLTVDLRTMEYDVWRAYFESKSKERDDRIQAEKDAALKAMEDEKKRIEDEKRIMAENEELRLKAVKAEKLAEQKRIEAEKEQEAIRAEAKKKADIEKAKADKIQADLEAKRIAEKVEADEKAKIAKDKADKALKIQQKKADEEAREKAVLQAKLDAQEEAKRKEIARIEKEKEALKKQGDKGSMNAIRDAIGTIISRIDKTELKSKTSNQTVNAVRDLLNEAWTKL